MKKIPKEIIIADKESTERAVKELGLKEFAEKFNRFENNPANAKLRKKIWKKVKKLRTAEDFENFVKDPANAELLKQWLKQWHA